MMLYKKTQWYRATVDQQARLVVPPEIDAPHGSYRCIKVLTPNSPQVHFGLDKEPHDIAMNRAYTWPSSPTGRVLEFYLQPDQFLSAVSETALAELSIIIEYYSESVLKAK